MAWNNFLNVAFYDVSERWYLSAVWESLGFPFPAEHNVIGACGEKTNPFHHENPFSRSFRGN